MISFFNDDIDGVIKARKNEGCWPFDDEVNVIDCVFILVDILVLLVLNRNQKSAKKVHDVEFNVLKENNLLVDSIVDFLGKLLSQLVR